MRWLHRLLHNCHKILAYLAQLHLGAQSRAKSSKGMCSIVLATIETPINDILKAATQGLKESGNCKGRSNNDNWRLRGLSCEQMHSTLDKERIPHKPSSLLMIGRARVVSSR